MQRDLDDWGVQATIASMLPRESPGYEDRSDQIDAWLVLWRLRHAGQDPRIAVLDDDPPAWHLAPCWVATTIAEGLTWDKATEALALLTAMTLEG